MASDGNEIDLMRDEGKADRGFKQLVEVQLLREALESWDPQSSNPERKRRGAPLKPLTRTFPVFLYLIQHGYSFKEAFELICKAPTMLHEQLRLKEASSILVKARLAQNAVLEEADEDKQVRHPREMSDVERRFHRWRDANEKLLNQVATDLKWKTPTRFEKSLRQYREMTPKEDS